MDWLPLDSSVFTSVRYVPDKRMLYLRFHSGDVYCYFDFPPEQFQDFLAADSQGRFFSSNIRDRFRCEHLARLGLVSNHPTSD
jgi:hypothetical protein